MIYCSKFVWKSTCVGGQSELGKTHKMECRFLVRPVICEAPFIDLSHLEVIQGQEVKQRGALLIYIRNHDIDSWLLTAPTE